MSWGFVAVAAVSAVSSIRGQNAAAGAANKNSLSQEEQAYKQNTADNEAIQESNTLNTIRTGYKVGLLNIQKAQAAKRAQQAGFDMGTIRTSLLGTNAANAAASGSIGASVDAVASDINMKLDQEVTQAADDYDIGTQNFETQMADILNAGQDALMSPAKVNIVRQEVKSVGVGEGLLQVGVAAASAYAGQKMSLGSGPTTSQMGRAGAPMQTFNVSPGTASIPSSVSNFRF